MSFVIFLLLTQQLLTFHAEPTPKLPGVQVSGVFDFIFVTDLVLDVVPVFGLDTFKYFLIVIPVKVLVLFFSTLSNILKIFESMAIQILTKRNTLGQFLKDLIPGWHFAIAVDIKSQRRSERFRRDDLDASMMVGIFMRVKILDVVDGVSELLFSRPEHRHLVYHVQVLIHVLRLHQRVLDGLVKQFLLLFLRSFGR